MDTSLFPALDPIPLPAPVWLFVSLHTLTLGLHFVAVHFLVGGLALATVWAFAGRLKSDPVLLQSSGVIAHRLPIVMTYVINLGVPPLLFAQVLYGRALYTSSVLIGVWWISVVGLLMLSYSLLYLMGRGNEISTAGAWLGLLALLVVMKIGMIYSANMSLMLRPDLWVAIYRDAPEGTTLGTGDPSVLPRWLFMMMGSVGVCGVALMALSMLKELPWAVGPMMLRWGGRLLAIFTVVQIALGFLVFHVQPEGVRIGLWDVPFYRICSIAWIVTAAALIVLGAVVSRRDRMTWRALTVVGLVSLVNVLLIVLVRDGIRYAALKLAGFNIWERAVSANWSTVILFLILFVGALAMLAWLVGVLARANPNRQYV